MATATESKTRAIGTVKVMADGKIKMVMTKPTLKKLSDAMEIAAHIQQVPGLAEKGTAVGDSIKELLEACE